MPWLIQYERQNAFCQWHIFKQECTDEEFTVILTELSKVDPINIRSIQAVRLPVTA